MPYRKGMLRQHGSELAVFHRVLDAGVIGFVLWVCAWKYDVELGPYYQLAGLSAAVGFLFFAEWQSLYSSWRADSLSHETYRITSIWLLTCCLLLALGFLTKTTTNFSRVTTVAWMLATPFFLVGERMAFRLVLKRLRSSGLNTRSVAIVGGGKNAAQLVDTILGAPWMGLRIEGVYDEENSPQSLWDTAQIHRDIESLFRKVQEGTIDYVYITYPMQQEDKIRQLVERLADSTVSVHVVPDFFVSELLHARWANLGGLPVISVFESPILGVNQFLKRVEDVVLGSLILLLIAPVMLLIAAAIKLTSVGPVIFKQRRYGLDGHIIEVWKFRSMSVMEDGGQIAQARKDDPRVTPLGAFLRKTSLDELPQFINVLQGRMSIVGPRPHAVAHNEQYRKLIHGYMLRHKVKPGITGWAQVNGWRGETDTIEKMEMRVKYDLAYINNWSLWFDLKIIWLTILAGMRHKNAY